MTSFDLAVTSERWPSLLLARDPTRQLFLGVSLKVFEPNPGYNELAGLAALVLSAMGLTVLVVWPQDGPGALVREKILRPLLPGRLKEALDCYVCLGFWAGLLVSVGFWWIYRTPWSVMGCLMVPTAFWIILRNPSGSSPLPGTAPESSTSGEASQEESPP